MSEEFENAFEEELVVPETASVESDEDVLFEEDALVEEEALAEEDAFVIEGAEVVEAAEGAEADGAEDAETVDAQDAETFDVQGEVIDAQDDEASDAKDDETTGAKDAEAPEAAAAPVIATSFGTVTDRLSEIATVVEDDTLPIDEALDLLEEAVALGMQASSLLEDDMNERNAEDEEDELVDDASAEA